MADDMSEVNDLSKAIGPKRVKTPQVEKEQFDPVTVIRAANMLRARNTRITMGSMDISIATPKGGTSCSDTCDS